MAVNRGSTHKAVAIKEATAGTTPATPTMIELPLRTLTPRFDNTVIRSGQIRTHPFVDKMLQGRFMADLDLEFELQGATHDMLIETMFGGTITTKALPVVDALKSLTLEDQVGGGSSLFDQYTYLHFTSMSITAAGNDTEPVRVSMSGAARTATLDAGATIATAVTAAGNPEPYTFVNASLTTNAVATPVAAGTINFERAVDPLMLWGSRQPREFVPGEFTNTGTITVPYDGSTQSTFFTGFTDAPLVFKFGDTGLATFRQFTMPKTKFVSYGKPINDRGMRMQEINWEAYYDSTSTTVCTMLTQ